jgi:MFS family permease
LLAAPLLASADSTIANVATPSIRHGLGASGSEAQLVVGGYIVAYAVLLITGARLGQTHGYKRLFLLGVAAFGITSLADGMAPDIGVLIGVRVLQGASAALMLPQVLTGIQLQFSGEDRTRAIGRYAVALSIGALVGQILGGVLISADIAGDGWRPIFLVNVPICLAVLACGARVLPPDERGSRGRLDLAGVAVLSIAVLCVVVPLTLGRDSGWPAWTWAALAASVPAFTLFLVTQRRALATGRVPLVNTRILARPAIVWGLVGLAGSTATYFALLFALAQYLQIGLGHSALFSGLILVPWVAAFGLAGQIRRRLPAELLPVLPVAGFLLLAAVYLALSGSVLAGALSTSLLAVLFIPGGLGLGIVFTALLGHVTAAASREHAPDISGVSATASQISASIGVAGFGSLYLSVAASHSPGHAFGITALAFGATALVATVPTYLAIRRPTHDRGRNLAGRQAAMRRVRHSQR